MRSGYKRKIAAPATRMDKGLMRNYANLQEVTLWTSLDSKKKINNAIKAFNEEHGLELKLSKMIEGEWLNLKFPESVRILFVSDENTIVVAFRGTKSHKWWETAINAFKDIRALLKHDLKFIGKDSAKKKQYRKIGVHRGFYNEYERYRDQIIKTVDRHKGKDLFVIGHSLGGALATLCSFDLAVHRKREVNSYLYGAPRVGGLDFRKAYEKEVPNTFRYNIHDDPIAKIPPTMLFDKLDYRHVGRLLLLNPNGSQVPLNNIDVTMDASFVKDLKTLHKKELYKKALGKFIAKIDYNRVISLKKTADKERKMAKNWLLKRWVVSS